MKKSFVLVLLLFVAVVALAQQKEARRIFFTYENGQTFRSTTGDTLTGVAAGSASLDTIYLSALSKGNEMARQILVAVTTTDINNIDTLVVTTQQGIGNDFEASAATALTLAAGADGFFEIRTDEGQEPALQYRVIFDATKGADTDSLSYVVTVYGVYGN